LKIRGLALLAAACLASAGAASADPIRTAQAGAHPVDGLPPYEILTIVRSAGFDPIGRPMRNGKIYTLLALDPYDAELRLIVDARTGRVLSANEVDARFAAPPPGYDGPPPLYPPGGAPVYGRIFGPPDDGLGRPRPPRGVPNAKPSDAKPPDTKPPESKTVATVAPLPRPRPYVVDSTVIETTAAIPEPPAARPAEQEPAPPQAPQDNGGSTLPPVTPLE
jgi:hypothetical protein